MNFAHGTRKRPLLVNGGLGKRRNGGDSLSFDEFCAEQSARIFNEPLSERATRMMIDRNDNMTRAMLLDDTDMEIR